MRSKRQPVAADGREIQLFMRFLGFEMRGSLRPVAPSFFQTLSIHPVQGAACAADLRESYRARRDDLSVTAEGQSATGWLRRIAVQCARKSFWPDSPSVND